jgi:glycosyltransferase involved in cell wall biosynthesis
LKIVFITARPPWPPRRGDQARAAGLIEVLAERHEIRVLSLVGPGFKPEPPPVENVSLEVLRVPALWVGLKAIAGGVATLFGGRRPVQAALFDLPSLRHHAAEVLDEARPDLVVVQLSRLADVLPALRGYPVLLDLIDSLALNMQNRAARGGLPAPFWRAEARRLLAWERAAVQSATVATVVAERDRAFLGGDRLRLLPFGIEIPEALPERTAAPEYELVLTGNLGYFPSVDGVRWFLREVWPLLCAELPEVRLLLAGARPSRSLRRLAFATPGVDLVADPPDLKAELRRGALALAPLRAGSGTPIKILEAIAEGLPVVASPMALEGLDRLPAGAAARAANAIEFRDAILRLLADPEVAEKQRRIAFEWVAEHHDRRKVAAQLESLLPKL